MRIFRRRLIETPIFAPWVFDALRDLETERGCTCEPQQEWHEWTTPADPTPRPSLWVDENGNPLTVTMGESHGGGMRWRHAPGCLLATVPEEG